MKIAVCIVNSPRAVDYSIPTIYENVIKPLDADVFGMFTVGEHSDDHDRISNINERVIEKDYWDPNDLPNILPKIFWDTHVEFASKIPENGSNNYLCPVYKAPGCAHNWYSLPPIYTLLKLYNMLKKHIDNYDFFIITRTDLYFLYPIFDKNILKNNYDNILTYDDWKWGGINCEFVILSKENFIKYCNRMKYFTDKEYIEPIISLMNNETAKNAEAFSRNVFKLEQFKNKEMSMNCFIAKDSSSLKQESFDKNPKLFFKKPEFYDGVIVNKNLWDLGGRWYDNGNKIFISGPRFIKRVMNIYMTNTNICIVRPTYYDRSAMLQLSLEYQKDSINSENFETYIFVDPHPDYGIVSDYDKVITDEYNRIDWNKNSGKYSWYDSVKYIFENTNYDYVLSIEDDVLISKDYLRLCEQLFHDRALNKEDNILYFHIGAWEKPKGNPNKIVRGGVSSRSILIYRKKFQIIQKWIEQENYIEDNDHMMNNILKDYSMTTIAPETNRHAHVGIYGWSANHVHGDSRGQSSLFENPLSHEELYFLLQQNCLSGEKLKELNKNKNPDYFWDFDPNIDFTKLEYVL